jgi:transposase
VIDAQDAAFDEVGSNLEREQREYTTGSILNRHHAAWPVRRSGHKVKTNEPRPPSGGREAEPAKYWFATLRVPSDEEEDAKRPSRERARLIKERIQHVNRIKGLLATQGCYDFDPRHRGHEARLAQLAQPAQLRAELAREFTRLALVLEQIAGLEAARDAVVKRAVAPADRATAKLGKLFTLKSMGPAFATTFVREVDYRDFANRRQVGGYFGLAGSPWLSGRRAVEQGISKAGNPRARTLMIEAAWTWLRHQPDGALVRWSRRQSAGPGAAHRHCRAGAQARGGAVALP